MKPICLSCMIKAPLEVVFRTVSDIRNFRKALPHITKVEFLSDQQFATGTRFRETRLMNGREQTFELEVVDYRENDGVRIRTDAGGTIWDSEFTVSQMRDSVELKMRMEAKAYTLFAKIMNPLIRRIVVKGVERDMDAVKSFCESGNAP